MHPMGLQQVEGQYLADYLLKVQHICQTETHSIFLKRRPICLVRNVDLRGRLLIQNIPSNLQRCSQRTDAGELQCVCSLCRTPTCQYLPGKSLYPCLIPQFLQLLPEDTSITLGSGGQQGLHSQVPQDCNTEGNLKQLPSPGHSKSKIQELSLSVRVL